MRITKIFAQGWWPIKGAILALRRLKGLSVVSAGLVIGFARMSDVAHWLSDVLWAGPITLVCSWLVWKGLLRLYDQVGHPP